MESIRDYAVVSMSNNPISKNEYMKRLSDIATIIEFPPRYRDPEKIKKLMNDTYSVSLFRPDISKVIFNDPATIIIWSDGVKTVVKCGENEVFDPEKGLAMAISKRFLGNKGNYFNEFKKWLPEHEVSESDRAEDDFQKSFNNAIDEVIKKLEENVKKANINNSSKTIPGEEDDDDRW